MDLGGGVIYVRRAIKRLDSGESREGGTKSAAGVRRAAMPEALVAVLDVHLRKHVAASVCRDEAALVGVTAGQGPTVGWSG